MLKVAVGAHVMLTTNDDVSDGLVNRARGEVVHIVTNTEHKVTTILVRLDNSRVGLKEIQSSPYRNTYTDAEPLEKYEVVCPVKGKKKRFRNYSLTVSTNTGMGNHNPLSA